MPDLRRFLALSKRFPGFARDPPLANVRRAVVSGLIRVAEVTKLK